MKEKLRNFFRQNLNDEVSIARQATRDLNSFGGGGCRT